MERGTSQVVIIPKQVNKHSYSHVVYGTDIWANGGRSQHHVWAEIRIRFSNRFLLSRIETSTV